MIQCWLVSQVRLGGNEEGTRCDLYTYTVTFKQAKVMIIMGFCSYKPQNVHM